MDTVQSFKLAPISPMYRTITVVYSVLTVGLLTQPLLVQSRGGGVTTLPAGLGLAALGALVLLWFRPRSLDVDPRTLTLKWVLRRRTIDKSKVLKAERVDARDLGALVRVGVGGLGGSFGLFRSSQRGWLDGYFTVQEGLVLLTLEDSRPLLLSPADAPGFLRSLGLGA